ncbi:ABC transporter B family member 27 [Tritrichomonas foetus]|uniref:ABC transporter B family member 27 n=1 Tax=Tritrichomonas foetus TaxID=1144522 RepID=A0A1J4J6U0_9EUKA|nr:ABC transporter B family member 27 [Tritrichomonas foetus]|eukprot:OHS94369.1 ABC transporter B family member 27 [Tritrichomonas foetus]
MARGVDDSLLLREENQQQQNDQGKNENKPKTNYLKFIPRMYWLFYRKPKYFLVLIPSMIPGTTNILSNYCIGKVIDSLGSDNTVYEVKKYSLLLFFYGLLSALCSYINYMGWITIGSSIGNKIRAILFKSLMNNDVAFFDTHQIGELLTLLTDDAKSVETTFTESKTSQLRFFGMFLSSIYVAFTIDWALAFITFISIIFASSLMKLLRQFALRHMNKRHELMSKSVTIADEALSNTRVVFSFNRQEKEIERYDEVINDGSYHDKLSRIFIGLGFSLSYIINWSTITFTLAIGCYRIVKGTITPGSLFSLSRVSFMGAIGLRNFLGTYHEEQKAIDASERIFRIADTQPLERATRTIPDFQGHIQFKNVWFKYPTRNAWVLKDVTFDIPPGEIAAFVGHSGSGKSTIVQLLLRFYDVNDGEILFDGIPATELDPRWIHRVVGVVQQDPQLFAISVKDNIRYSSYDASDEAIIRSAEIALCDKFIRKLPNGYDHNVGEKGGSLSGGQKQRIAIARAVLKDPTVLITDEATSALDSESEKKVQLALDEVMRGRTSLIIAHRLGTIRAAKMIYVFESGKLVERGTHDELLELQGHYYNLVLRQLNGMTTTTSEEQIERL